MMSVSDQIKIAVEITQKAKRIFVLTGAGVSAESGVPTFRGGGGATVWRGMPFEQLSSAQMVEENLPLVWEWFDYRRNLLGDCQPNAAHEILAAMQKSERFQEFSIVTQNIDGLHQAAGADNVIELHGSVWRARCLFCKATQSLREIPAEMRPPICPNCADSMRPDVILFGEAMPMQAVYEAQERAETSDVCIVVGTSALVYPAAELPLIAKQSGAKIIEINPEETALSQAVDISLRGKAAEILPLIFAEYGASNPRLSNEDSVKPAAPKTRNEPQTEDLNNGQSEEKTLPNNPPPKSDLMTSESHPLRVAFLEGAEAPVLKNLGLTFAPGKKQTGAMSGIWHRDLTTDLTRLRDHYQTDTLVSLIEDAELNELGIENLQEECRYHNIELIRFPLTDVSVPPSLKKFVGLIRKIVKRLANGKKVVVHCKGGLGRAGLTTACTIVAAGDNKIGGAEAVAMVRRVRPGAVETKEQENFASVFGEYWQLYGEKIEDVLRQQKAAVKEKVLTIGAEGGGLDLFRFRAGDGKWYFCTAGSSISLDENDDEEWINWESDAVETISEAINDFNVGINIFRFRPIFLHSEYRTEIKEYLENLYAALSDDEKIRLRRFDEPLTPEKWLAEAVERTRHKAEREKFRQQKNDESKSNQTHQSPETAPALQPPSDKHFVLYWQERSVAAHEESGYPLDVVSSRQLKRANAGDTLWLVTINGSGELVLAGRLKIGEIVDYQTAVRRLNDTSLWDGGFYALPAEGEAERLRRTNIRDIQLDLRFANTETNRFVLKNGKINAQQLQTMRELTQESADALREIWESVSEERNEDFGKDELDDLSLFDERIDPAELLEACRRHIREQPDSSEAYYNLGVAFDENDLPAEANAAYLRALELEPNYWAAHYNLGQNYLRSGNLKKAEDAFIHTTLLAQEFAPAHFMLGVVYGEMKNFHEAIAATERGLAIDPNDPKAYFNLGNFYFHLRIYEIAVGWLEHSLEIAPDNPTAFYRLGECFRHLGEKEKEFDAYREAVELSPDFDALFALGTAYAHLSGTAEGERVAYFATGGAVDARDARVFFYMGLGNLALNDVEEARENQRRLSETDASLAERLQFFIDRFVPNSESANVESFDIERIDESQETKPNLSRRSATSKKRELIEIYIDDYLFEKRNIPELYESVLRYLVDEKKLENVTVPVATGEKRYILAKEPVHPTGKSFLAPIEYGGFFMEAHNNRTAAIAQLKKLVEGIGCTFNQYSLTKIANHLKETGREISYGEIGTYVWYELDKGNISRVENFLEIIKDNLADGTQEAAEKAIAEAKQKNKQDEKINSSKTISKSDAFQGCLLGGAVGDALGAAIEFDSIQMIRRKFGEQGLSDYAPAYGRIGAITDDTQMTLFTAEGLLRAITRQNHKGICHAPTVIYHAYLRWLETQGEKIRGEQIQRCVYEQPSWLRDLPELNSLRAPGNSCLSALRSGKMGAVEEPINNSKGCGGVMRVAPIGLIADDAFGLAIEAAAITHGHPTGYLSAGVLASIIRQIVDGKGLSEAINHAVYEELPKHKNHEETLAACDKAIKLAFDRNVSPNPETIEMLGGGWIAEEALAIAVYCSLVHENDFRRAVLLAVNHSGDSDSTGAITGNILGALHGAPTIPDHWLERLELREAISEIAEDLLTEFMTGDEWWSKYPGV